MSAEKKGRGTQLSSEKKESVAKRNSNAHTCHTDAFHIQFSDSLGTGGRNVYCGAKHTLRIFPESGAAQYNLAAVYLHSGRSIDALSLLTTALSNGADQDMVLVLQADCYISLKKSDAGIADNQKALKIRYDDDAIICYKIACAFLLQNKVSDALAWLEKALKKGLKTEAVEKDAAIEPLKKTDEYKNLIKEYSY